MNTCDTCPHSAALNPHFADMPFSETPCASCKLIDRPRHGEVQLTDRLDHPNEGTWQPLDVYQPAEPTSDGAELLRLYLGSPTPARGALRFFVLQFSEREELDCIDLIFHHHKSGAANARARGRSRPAQFKAMKKLSARIQEVGERFATANREKGRGYNGQ